MLATNYAIKFRTAMFVFAVVACIGGSISYLTLPREGAPDITIPYVFVTAVYEGVAPEEMENLVTIPLEKQFKDLENVKEMTSTSSEGVSMIAIEFTPKEDIDTALQKVKDKMDLARPDLPNDLDEPVAQAFNFSTDFPILMLALHGDPDLERLKSIAEDLQDEIEAVPGVKQAPIYGAREREIRIIIDLPRLVAYRIPVGDVIAALARENRTTSAGNLEINRENVQVRIPGEFEQVTQVRNILVAQRDGRPVYLTDVASVENTYKDLSSISRINGEDCLSLHVKKRSGENTVRLSDRIQALLKTFPLPQSIRVTVIMDQARDVRLMLKDLENNIASGFILVVVILFLFMGARNALLVAVAIPFSMLISFMVMSVQGVTMNMIVLFSLVIAVGMLVDNAIVIVENIYRNHMEGLSRVDAARRGASEVAWPVITSTLTTVAAFLPLLYWPDIMGQFMGFLPRTLIITLTSSLVVAITINPAICSFFIRRGRAGKGGGRFERFQDRYERVLRAALRSRGLIVLLGVVVLFASIELYKRFGRGLELFPDTQPRSATIAVKFPQGTPIERTDAAVRGIESRLGKYGDIRFFLSNVGNAVGRGMESQAGTHLGSITVEFVDFEVRRTDSREMIAKMREDIVAIPGAEVTVDREQEGPPTGAPVSLELSGDDFDVLSDLASEIIRKIKGVPGLADVQDDFEEAKPELQFRVDRQRAALLGLDPDSIGFFLRTAVYGTEASKFRAGEDQFDMTVRLPLDQRNSADLLEQAMIPTPDGRTVPLSSLGEPVYTGGRGDIRRKDRKRVITITGDRQGERSIDQILADVREIVSGIRLPPGYTVTYTGENQDINESGAFLAKAFAAAVGLIAFILVLQFNSALLPAIILMSVVLSMIGVMWGLLICRMRFGVIMTGLGVISLAGVVVNNSIVLIDCIQQHKAGGKASFDAIILSARQRLRPVLLTAITTILGLVPMAIGYSLEIHDWPPHFARAAESSSWWAPMAVSVIFGLALSTTLTLIQVPVMVSLLDTVAGSVRRRADKLYRENGAAESTPVEPSGE